MLTKFFAITNRVVGPSGFGDTRNPIGNTLLSCDKPNMESANVRQPAGFMVDLRLLGKPITVVIHGFNNTPERALKLYGDCCDALGDATTVVLYMWPSEGRIWDYGQDRQRARESAGDLLSALVMMRFLGQTANVLAHSMGNYVLDSTLQMDNGSNGKKNLVNKALLVAADIGDTALNGKQWSMVESGLVLYSPDDGALEASSLLHDLEGETLKDLSFARLGLTGHVGKLPEKWAQRNCAALLPKGLEEDFDPIMNHGGYFKSSACWKLMREFLG